MDERQEKLLDENYVATRLRDVKEIRNKEVMFRIHHSDRPFSKSLYVTFMFRGEGDKFWERTRLRISDHPSNNLQSVTKDFVVEPRGFLSKKVKDNFMSAVQMTINKGKLKNVYKIIENII